MTARVAFIVKAGGEGFRGMLDSIAGDSSLRFDTKSCA